MEQGALTPKQALFVRAYLGDADCNATEAARMAGYKGDALTLASVGCENLRKPYIAQVIRQALAERCMSQEEALDRLTRQARGSMEDFTSPVTTEEGREALVLDVRAARAGRKLGLVKKLTYTQYGPTLELYDAQAALQAVLKRWDVVNSRVPAGTAEDPEHMHLTISVEERRAKRRREIIQDVVTALKQEMGEDAGQEENGAGDSGT